MCNLRIATSEAWKDKNTGERREKTEWHSVAIFQEGLVRIAEQYLRKGSKIYIEGKLTTRSWEQNGEKRYATEVEGREMQMLDSKTGQAAPKKAAVGFDIDPSDLPFD